VDLYIHSTTRLHCVVLNKLSKGQLYLTKLSSAHSTAGSTEYYTDKAAGMVCRSGNIRATWRVSVVTENPLQIKRVG
jgi:hypothetical protein